MRTANHSALTAALALLMLVPATEAFADGWPQKKGEGYYSIRFSGFQAAMYFEPTGNAIDIPTVGAYSVSLYGEYGLTNRVTLVGTIPFERLTLNEQIGAQTGILIAEGAAVNSVADARIGVRVGLWQQGSTVLSAALTAGLPIGNDTQENGLYTGDGEFNQTAALEVGHSFWPRDAYITASGGFNQRTSGYSDELVYAVQAGYAVTSRLALDARISGVESLKNGDALSTGLGFRANDQRYIRYGVNARFAAGANVDVSVGAERAARRRSTLSGTMFSLAVAWKG